MADALHMGSPIMGAEKFELDYGDDRDNASESYRHPSESRVVTRSGVVPIHRGRGTTPLIPGPPTAPRFVIGLRSEPATWTEPALPVSFRSMVVASSLFLALTVVLAFLYYA